MQRRMSASDYMDLAGCEDPTERGRLAGGTGLHLASIPAG
jgi:hypothetical protein